MKTKLSFLVVLGIALVGGAVVPANANTIEIDTFEYGSLSNFMMGYGTWSASESAAGVLGGTRAMEMAALGSGGSGVLSTNILGGDALLGTITGSSAYSGQWVLSYDANGAGLAADLLDGTNNAFQIEIPVADHGLTIDITVTDGDGTVDTKSINLTGAANPVIAFSWFSSAVDFSDVDKIEVKLTGVDNGDYAIEKISALYVPGAPEPATITLCLAGFGLLIRRRK